MFLNALTECGAEAAARCKALAEDDVKRFKGGWLWVGRDERERERETERQRERRGKERGERRATSHHHGFIPASVPVFTCVLGAYRICADSRSPDGIVRFYRFFCANTPPYTHARTDTIPTIIHTHVYTCTVTHTPLTQTHTHTHTHTHARTHTHTHTHTHTRTRTCADRRAQMVEDSRAAVQRRTQQKIAESEEEVRRLDALRARLAQVCVVGCSVCVCVCLSMCTFRNGQVTYLRCTPLFS